MICKVLYIPGWLFGISEPSTVVWLQMKRNNYSTNFFRQQQVLDLSSVTLMEEGGGGLSRLRLWACEGSRLYSHSLQIYSIPQSSSYLYAIEILLACNVLHTSHAVWRLHQVYTVDICKHFMKWYISLHEVQTLLYTVLWTYSIYFFMYVYIYICINASAV